MKQVAVQAYTFQELDELTQKNTKEKFTVTQGLMVDYCFNDNPKDTLKTKIKNELYLNGIPKIFLDIFNEFEIFNHKNGISFISISMNNESFFLNEDLVIHLVEIAFKLHLISATTYFRMMELISVNKNKYAIEIKKEINSFGENNPDLFLDFYTEIFFDKKELLILAKETPTLVKDSFKLQNIIEICLNNLIIKSNKLLNKDKDVLEEYKNLEFEHYIKYSLFLESGQKILQYEDIKQNKNTLKEGDKFFSTQYGVTTEIGTVGCPSSGICFIGGKYGSKI